MEFIKLAPRHEGVVHDIAFDYYGNVIYYCYYYLKIIYVYYYVIKGKRVSTCGADREIKVWDLDGDGKWTSEKIRAHTNSIWRLSWSHPEFGQLIASCSEDTTVCVWEEQESITTGNRVNADRWLKKVTLTESKKAVNDVKFSPRHLGLRLATASADGSIRIYEATDIFSLSYWQLVDTIQVEDTTGLMSEMGVAETSILRQSEHGLTCLSWNDCPFEPAKIAVGGFSRFAAVWTCDQKTGKWKEECILGDHVGVVHDIAWAPVMGRSFHQIATASRDNIVKVFTLTRKGDGSLECKGNPAILTCKSPVWRVAWNATGTILATSGDDGALSLWRKNFDGHWVSVQDIQPINENLRNNYKSN